MSIPLRLFHTILNTHSTWLHGDPRGFRSRDHRIHSSGDYKNPPPKEEHAGLYVYQLTHSAEPTILRVEAFAIIGNAIVENLTSRGHEVEAVAVNATHAHQLVWLPDDLQQIKTILGWAKRFATRAAREKFEELRDLEIGRKGRRSNRSGMTSTVRTRAITS